MGEERQKPTLFVPASLRDGVDASTEFALHECVECGESVVCTPDCRAETHRHEDCIEKARAWAQTPWYIKFLLHARAWLIQVFVGSFAVAFIAFKRSIDHGRDSPGCGYADVPTGKRRIEVTWSWDDTREERLRINTYCNVCLRPFGK